MPDGGGTSDETSPSGGDEADLLTGGGEPVDGSGLAQVLVVTTSVGMVDGVHPDTSHDGESLSESLVLVPEGTGLHDGLLVAASTGNDADSGSAVAVDGLPGTGGESDSGLGAILGVPDDGGVGARASGVGSLVADAGLDVADGSSLGDAADGENVAGGDGGLPAGEDVLSGVGALSSEEVFGFLLIFVGVSEVDLDEGAPTAGVMEYSSDDSLDVSLSLDEVEIAISGGSNSLALGGSINTALFTLSLA